MCDLEAIVAPSILRLTHIAVALARRRPEVLATAVVKEIELERRLL